MEETYLLNHPGVKKKILAGGTGPLPHFPPGTKLVFHFQTLLDDFERTVIDDSRSNIRPTEIFVGKMFKMEVWETLLTSMRIGEVAEFWCDATHTGLYPMVSKGMRLAAQGKDPLEGQRHTCGMGNLFHYHSTGYPELDELMRTPQPLIFIMELLQAGDPTTYKRESWMMEKDEKMETVPTLHMQGNALVKQRRFREAAARYKEAVLLLKTVQSREMPGDIDYINLGHLIVPLELNYCQCMLELEEYYEVIDHTTELLEKHKGCVKGYYKRAKAHAAVWNEKEARKDFNMVASLDVTLASLVHKELKALSESMKEKYWEEKEKYWNMLEKKEESKNEEEEEEEEEEDEKEKGKSESTENAESLTTGEEESQSEEVLEEVRGNKEEETVRVAATEGTANNKEETQPETNPNAPSKTEGMDWQQMLRLVMFLQDEGNFLMKENRCEEASRKFTEAIEYVDFLQYKRVGQKGEDWESLEKVRLPLTLNLSQCMLELHQYQQVVELNNKLLKKHKGNFKAMYQRARAHSALCHEDEARRDFARVEDLDPSLKPLVRQELKRLGENIRTMHGQQKKTYRDATREKWGPGGSKAATVARAERKVVRFARKENAATGDEDGEAEEEPATAEKDGVSNAEIEEKDPDEERKEEMEGTRAVVVQEDRQAAADNRVGDEDSDPAPTRKVADNVASKRSGPDKGGKKVKCQSTASREPGGASRGNEAAIDNTGSGGTRSESTDGSELSAAADPKAAGERSEADKPEEAEEGGKSHVDDAGSETGGKTGDEQPAEAEVEVAVARAAVPRASAGNIDPATKPPARKHKKKKRKT